MEFIPDRSTTDSLDLDLFHCGTRNNAEEDKITLHLPSLITKTHPKSKVVLFYINFALVLSQPARTTGSLTQLQWWFQDTAHHPFGLAPPSGPSPGDGRVQ
jgi:hypothetical protein